jgi:SAM-dependent methyltransferase
MTERTIPVASPCCTPATAGTPGCCSPVREEDAALAADSDVRAVVREKYGAVVEGRTATAGCCAGPAEADAVLEAIGYRPEDRAAVPEGSNLGLGCGNPIAHAGLAAGETVLDLGSGAGIDCFLAARAVGPSGRVIGVDMTPAMVEKARANAARHGYANVEFRLGEIEALPVADASVDAIISNCVINLSPDKPRVFREAMRALKPGGRLLVSDLVLNREIAPEARRSVALYVGCVAGASLREEYLALVRQAGFERVEVVEDRSYGVGADRLERGSAERDAFDAVSSIKVRAIRP